MKPENVLLTDDGKVKVADFGLARAISAATSTAATQGLLIGTVAYLSPEQVERGIADARSDVYGAGILLYEMVTGSVPFAGETPLAVAYQHVNAAVPAPSSVRPDVPAALDALVASATARDADDRYPDAASFLADVREAKRGMPVPRPFGVSEDQAATLVVPMTTAAGAGAAGRTTAPVVTPPAPAGNAAAAPMPRKRRRRGWIGLLAVLLVGALVAGGAWVYGAARTVTMPSVVGLTPTAAAAKLTPLGLSLDANATDFSETVAAGKIISTDPKPGGAAKQDSTVSAVVSKGPERHAVPVVAGMTVDDATTAIEGASLTVGATTGPTTTRSPAGNVVTTNPAPATSLKRDQAVALVVSQGPAPVKLPNYVGTPAAPAVAALQKAGLKVTSTTAYDKKVPAGSVVSMTPKAGADRSQGQPGRARREQGSAAGHRARRVPRARGRRPQAAERARLHRQGQLPHRVHPVRPRRHPVRQGGRPAPLRSDDHDRGRLTYAAPSGQAERSTTRRSGPSPGCSW